MTTTRDLVQDYLTHMQRSEKEGITWVIDQICQRISQVGMWRVLYHPPRPPGGDPNPFDLDTVLQPYFAAYLTTVIMHMGAHEAVPVNMPDAYESLI